MASAKMKIGMLKNRSPPAAPKTISKDASPDSKCPICLDQFRNISYVDKCMHRFCFRCIHEWAKNKAECPLCKQPFSSIYHSVKAEDDFQQYHLRPTETGSFGSLAGQRFRYRTTLTRDRQPGRRTSPPPDHGVMFEGLSGGGSASHGNDRGFRRMVARLAARQRAQSEGRTLRTLHEQEMIQYRRMLYRRGLQVRDVRDGGRSRDTSAEFFRGNPACLHRLVPWLKRELTVLYGTHGSLVNIVQHIVMSQITRYDMQNPAVIQELRPFLLSRTEHFLHEFQSFARSPFNMEAYDQNAVYDCPAPSAEDSGDSDSSIVTVSEDEANLPETRAPVILSQTPWDDETPGPSYSESLQVLTVSVTSSDSDGEEEAGPSAGPSVAPARIVTGEENHSGGEDDCMIVGYVKPTAERTPELVQLSSDTEEDVEEIKIKNNQLFIRTQPQHIRFISPPDSPSSYQSPSPHRPTATDRKKPSRDSSPDPSSDQYSTLPSCLSAVRERKKDSNEERQDSKSKRKDLSRNRDSSSHGRKRRSHSKERKQCKETSSFHCYHTHRSKKSSKSCTTTHYSNVHRITEKQERYQAQSRDRSWSRERYHAQLRDHTHTRSREHSRTWSLDHSRPRSQERSQVRSRNSSRSRSRERSRSRLQDHTHTLLWECSNAHSREPSHPCSGSRSYSSRSYSSRSHSRRSPSWERRQTRHPSPASTDRKSRSDKPGGKRKYKSLHLEPTGTEATERPAEDRQKRSSGKRERKHRSSQSPSMEIVNEGDSGKALLKKHHRKKKKHKKKSKRKRSRERRDRKSPTIITINSESDSDGHGKDMAVKHPSAKDVSVTSNIPITSDNKAELSLFTDSNTKNAANDANNANSSSMTPDFSVHSVSRSDENITAFSLTMSHSSTNANNANDTNDSNDGNGANNANSSSIPSTSSAESCHISRTITDSAEPESATPTCNNSRPNPVQQNTLACAGLRPPDDQ